MRPILSLILFVAFAGAACDPTAMLGEHVRDRGTENDQWWKALPREAWSGFDRVDQSQPWFEVFQIADGVTAIYEPGQFEEVISYLITGEQRALLLDTGLGIGDMMALTRELTSLPVTVVNSHSHYDHIGGNADFPRIMGAGGNYAGARQEGLTHQAVAEFVGPGWIWKETPSGFAAAQYQIRPYVVGEVVKDGQLIDLGGRTLEVVLTPGHSPDSLCLLDRDNRMLFTGDTFYPAPLYTHLPGSSFDDYAVSSKKLSRLRASVDVLLPGHNVPMVSADYLPRMAAAFDAISGGNHPFVMTDGHRQYKFDGFSVITDTSTPATAGELAPSGVQVRD